MSLGKCWKANRTAIQKLFDQWTILHTSVAFHWKILLKLKPEQLRQVWITDGSDPQDFFRKPHPNTKKNTTEPLCASWHIKNTLSATTGSANICICFQSILSCSLPHYLKEEWYITFFTNCHTLADQWVNVSTFHLWKPQFNSLNYFGNKRSIVFLRYRPVFEEL